MGGLRKLRRTMRRAGNLPAPPKPPPPPPRVRGDQAQARMVAIRTLPKLQAELDENKRKGGENYVPSPRDILIGQTLAASRGEKWVPPQPKVTEEGSASVTLGEGAKIEL